MLYWQQTSRICGDELFSLIKLVAKNMQFLLVPNLSLQ